MMTLATVLQLLLGAALVSIGVLASAISDRIRGRHRSASRVQTSPATNAATNARARASRAARAAKPAPVSVVPDLVIPKSKDPDAEIAAEVAAALVASGYNRRAAGEAVKACVGDERATIETWMRAALRRCARSVA